MFGSISGALSAELTGEGGALRKCPVDIFSERASMRRESQGAATGMTVSALNHVAHRMSIKIITSTMAHEFEEAYGTTKSLNDAPPATVDEIQRLTDDLPTLNDLVNDKLSGQNIKLSLRPNIVGKSGGGYIQGLFAQGTLTLFKGAFRSYGDLISTLYHEYNHAYNMIFLRRNWPTNLKLRDNIDEYLAYKAEYGYTSSTFAKSQMNYYKQLIPSNYH